MHLKMVFRRLDCEMINRDQIIRMLRTDHLLKLNYDVHFEEIKEVFNDRVKIIIFDCCRGRDGWNLSLD